jgi:hypothetical protein
VKCEEREMTRMRLIAKREADWKDLKTFQPTFVKNKNGRVPVAHTCNPSYSGGRDQEDHILKPARANSSRDPISKLLITKCWWNGSR